jgi:hypothetical protein
MPAFTEFDSRKRKCEPLNSWEPWGISSQSPLLASVPRFLR